ncbi:Yif1 family like protein [Aduncisulcus paluster]|uniref:Protein YIF1 n=1 Tax=Aduncisulcus paluster TaxID=2918883 RepID=A0ABQ5K4N9_9EUKA|nr:Yif1 family like protein [Aduncisulcus paluster]|eukprot:gnl/Carplike_NY0171/5617_a7692_325.p1 GENE.gnl/Carplike_NY0171/5617_a7692_325~~gnl/Carplike_NY0171/5617_a7692_325.p1  ORF type:complete len:265 (-),score=34.93 gnl/Carplike_NY0171/5617_a7692_325:29-799(-)
MAANNLGLSEILEGEESEPDDSSSMQAGRLHGTKREYNGKPLPGYGQFPLMPPYLDVAAPDLYIPVMSFVTYILLSCITLGSRDEIGTLSISKVFSFGIAMCLVEFFIVRGILWLCSLRIRSNFDLLASLLYVLVPVSINLLFGSIFGTVIYYIISLYSSAAFVSFQFKSLRWSVLGSDVAVAGIGQSVRSLRTQVGTDAGLDFDFAGDDDEKQQKTIESEENRAKKALFVIIGICLLQVLMIFVLGYSPAKVKES